MSKKNELPNAKLIISYKADQTDPAKKRGENDEKDFEEEDLEELKDDDEDDVNGDDVENIRIYNETRVFYLTQAEPAFEVDPSYK